MTAPTTLRRARLCVSGVNAIAVFIYHCQRRWQHATGRHQRRKQRRRRARIQLHRQRPTSHVPGLDARGHSAMPKDPMLSPLALNGGKTGMVKQTRVPGVACAPFQTRRTCRLVRAPQSSAMFLEVGIVETIPTEHCANYPNAPRENMKSVILAPTAPSPEELRVGIDSLGLLTRELEAVLLGRFGQDAHCRRCTVCLPSGSRAECADAAPPRARPAVVCDAQARGSTGSRTTRGSTSRAVQFCAA